MKFVSSLSSNSAIANQALDTGMNKSSEYTAAHDIGFEHGLLLSPYMRPLNATRPKELATSVICYAGRTFLENRY